MIHYNKTPYNKEFVYSKIIYNNKKYIYEYTVGRVAKAPANAPWQLLNPYNFKNPLLDKWFKRKNNWKSDEEVDYIYSPELRTIFVNNLIIFSRKLKLEKLLKS